MTETSATYVANPETGEVLDDGWDPQDPDDDGERGLSIINPADPASLLPSLTNLPPHFQALQLEKYSPEEQTERVLMATEYLGAPRDLVDFMNLDIEVAGAALIWNPPYHPNDKGAPPDFLAPGYFNGRLKLTDGIIIKTSSGKICQVIAGLIPALGWYDWKVPVTFHVEMKNGAHYISRVKKGAAKK